MRPRLARLVGLLGDLAAGARRRGRPMSGRPPSGMRPTPEQRSADEVKRRLDATRERLRRETPPPAE
jgi:hypothetical protein